MNIKLGITRSYIQEKENNVGNPLSKDFLDKVRDGVLATQSGQLAEKVLTTAKSVLV